jgi:molybdate transport system substrate-binding protein
MAAAPLTLSGISSMATRLLLAELAEAWEDHSGHALRVEAVGGVDAAKRVAAGEAFDVVFLAADAIDKLLAAGHLVAGSRVDLVRSPVAIAVREGAALPDISSEASLKAAVLAARSLSFSTGPSGVYLAKLFERWGIADQVASRMVQAPPGVPVGSLVARGEAELGFQQLSELMHLKGITVVGAMPLAVQFITTFSGALCGASAQGLVVRELLAWMASPATAEAKRRQGMDPA